MAEPNTPESPDSSLDAPELADLQAQMDAQEAAEAAKNAPPEEEVAKTKAVAKKKGPLLVRLFPFMKGYVERKQKAKEEREAQEAAQRAAEAEQNIPKPPKVPLGQVFGEMLSALRSPDPLTRKMAWVFFVGILGMGFIGVVVYERYIRYQDIKKYQSEALEATSKNISEFIQRQAEQAKQRFSTLTLGKFTVDMKEVPGAPKPNRGVMNVAEVEIVISTDGKETRYFIEDHLAQAQDQVMSVLGTIERDDLLTREGKRRLKKRIIDRLNSWLPKGKIEDLFFSDILAS